MKKKFAALSAGLLSIICLAGCAKQVTLSELTAQASQYDLDAVRAEYSSCTVTTDIYFYTENETYAAVATSLSGYENGGTVTSERERDVEVAVTADLTNAASYVDEGSDAIKYYLDGTAIKITIDYEGEVDYGAYGGEGSIKYEFTTYSDGRYKKEFEEYKFTDSNDYLYEISTTRTYSYTKA